LATACRKKSSCAKVAWHKINFFRKFGTQENCGPTKEFAAAGIRMIDCVEVRRLRRDVVRKGCTKAKDERATQSVRPLRKYLWMDYEGKSGMNF
jgi:hypothetical protein